MTNAVGDWGAVIGGGRGGGDVTHTAYVALTGFGLMPEAGMDVVGNVNCTE